MVPVLNFFSFTSPSPCFFKMFYVYFYPVRGLQLWIICCPPLVPHFLNFDFYVSVLVHCPYFLTFSSLHPLAFKMLFLCLLVPTLVSLFSVFSCLSCTSLLFKFSFQDHFSGLSLSFNSFLSVVLHVAFKLSFCVCFYPVHCLYFLWFLAFP